MQTTDIEDEDFFAALLSEFKDMHLIDVMLLLKKHNIVKETQPASAHARAFHILKPVIIHNLAVNAGDTYTINIDRNYSYVITNDGVL